MWKQTILSWKEEKCISPLSVIFDPTLETLPQISKILLRKIKKIIAYNVRKTSKCLL